MVTYYVSLHYNCNILFTGSETFHYLEIMIKVICSKIGRFWWGDDAGLLLVPGHPTNLAHQYANLDSTEPTALASGAGGDFSIFFLSDIISVFYFPLFERHIDIDRNTISKSS